ncbi:MAG: response regulator [Treponema sp.]|jgi:CheY-like chemotaxis protein|nr:response regulator [Treponema sp.]
MDNDKKNTVLVVDDEKINREILKNILGSDYTVYMAKDGPSTVEMADKLEPDVILLDIVMPDMNGYDVLKILKQNEKTKNIPVIFITGLDSVEDEEKGLALDAVDFIHKPFSAMDVKLRVNKQLQKENQSPESYNVHTNGG